ncbi:MAG: hypothetical protein QF475_00605 [Candidatus Undinarchaeales archaeon]|jgi:hypothetical protein|nr:hypothetical protein [Candidatus Undinarchaeales archaeon]
MAGFAQSLYYAMAPLAQATIGLVPKAVAAIIIVIVGFIIGKLIGAAIEEILLKARVDQYVRSKRTEIKLSHIFAVILKWVIYLVFLQQAAHTLAIPIISTFLGEIIAFLPGVIEAIIIVGVGYALARYVEGLVRDSEVAYSGISSKVFFFFILYLAIALALPNVGINATLVNSILLMLVGAGCLGGAIAVGLGAKETIGTIAKKYLLDVHKEITKAETRRRKR